MLATEHAERLFAAWDKLDNAAQNVESALPQKMSVAIGELTLARKAGRPAAALRITDAGRKALEKVSSK